LEHHVQKLQDRDSLNERVQQLEQELQIAQATVTKLVSDQYLRMPFSNLCVIPLVID